MESGLQFQTLKIRIGQLKWDWYIKYLKEYISCQIENITIRITQRQDIWIYIKHKGWN